MHLLTTTLLTTPTPPTSTTTTATTPTTTSPTATANTTSASESDGHEYLHTTLNTSDLMKYINKDSDTIIIKLKLTPRFKEVVI